MAQDVSNLTERERAVLRLMAQGHTAKSAASELGLSVHTVNDYLREARQKLGVGSSREAARAFVEMERGAPEKLGSKEIGIGDPGSGAAEGGIAPPRPGLISRRGWIIAGVLMLTALVALALVAGSPAATRHDPAPVASAVASAADRAADSAAQDWLALMDKGEWDASWQAAGPLFKQAITAAGWEAQGTPVRKPLGALTRRALLDVATHAELPGAPKGDYRILRYAADYAEAKGTIETVVMQNDGGTWKGVGYFIR